jgi:hypothetical protein
LGDDPAHARLIGGGPHHEAAAEGETEQGDVVQVEIVEDGGDGLVPLGGHGYAVLECGALARTVEGDNVEALGAHGDQDGHPLLDVAVEAAEYHDPPARPVGGQTIRRQLPALIRHAVVVIGADVIGGQHFVDEGVASDVLSRVASSHEELRGPNQIRTRKRPSPGQRLLALGEELPGPVVVCGDGRGDGAQLVQHGRLADPVPEPV